MSFEWVENRKKLEGMYKTLSEKQSQDIKFTSTNYETNRASSKWLDEKSSNYHTVYSSKNYKTISPKNKFVSDLRKNFKEFQKKTNIKLKLEDKAYLTHHQFGNFNKNKKLTLNYATIDNFDHKFTSNKKSIKNPKIHSNTTNIFFPSLQTQTQNLSGKHPESQSNKNFYKKLLKGRLLKIISQSIVLKQNEIESYKNKKKDYLSQMQQDHIAEYRKDKNLGIITQKNVELFPLKDNPITSRCEDLYLTPNELLLNHFTLEELKIIKSDPIYFQLNKGAFRDITLLKNKTLLETLDEEEKEQENKIRLRTKSNGTEEKRITTGQTSQTNQANNTNKTNDALLNENNSNDSNRVSKIDKDSDIQSLKTENFSGENIANEKKEIMPLSLRKNKIDDTLKDNFPHLKLLPTMKSNKLHINNKLVKNENEFVAGNKLNLKDNHPINKDKILFELNNISHKLNPMNFIIKNNSIASKASYSKRNSKNILKFDTITLHKLSPHNSPTSGNIIIDDNNKDSSLTIRQNNNINSNVNKQKLQEESIWRDSYVNKIKENYLSSYNKH